MLIYRVESFDGEGPYNLPVGFKSDDNRHPLPEEGYDVLANFWQNVSLMDMRKYFFGFGSIEQLNKWFGAEEQVIFSAYNKRAKSDDEVVGISTYDCLDEDCVVGDAQAVFIRERAQQLEFQPFSLHMINNVMPA